MKHLKLYEAISYPQTDNLPEIDAKIQAILNSGADDVTIHRALSKLNMETVDPFDQIEKAHNWWIMDMIGTERSKALVDALGESPKQAISLKNNPAYRAKKAKDHQAREAFIGSERDEKRRTRSSMSKYASTGKMLMQSLDPQKTDELNYVMTEFQERRYTKDQALAIILGILK
jgi:hypothetical protein